MVGVDNFSGLRLFVCVCARVRVREREIERDFECIVI